MNVLIFGYGLQGKGFSSAMFFLKKGHQVRLTDLRDANSLGEGVVLLRKRGVSLTLGKNLQQDFDWANVIVKAPAVDPDNQFLKNRSKVTTDFAYLFSNGNARDVKVILIAGKHAKSETASAICHALNYMGYKTRLCGNMGRSPFNELEKWEHKDIPQYLVCECSSMQIRDLGIYLTDNRAKVELLVAPDSTHVPVLPVKHRVYDGQNRHSSMSKDFPLNLSASYSALVELGFKPEIVNKALKSYKGVSYRTEIVASQGNIIIVNDSSSVLPGTTVKSVFSFKDTPVHLICGGTDSTLDAGPMVDALKKCSKIHLLAGTFTDRCLIPLLRKNGIEYDGPYELMEEAVNSAVVGIDNTKNIQILMLSPACPAYEYYRDEYDRGDCFNNCFFI